MTNSAERPEAADQTINPTDEAPEVSEPATGLGSLQGDKTFAEFDVDQRLADALADKGITHPFPIQALTLPMALDGHDIIGQARTGTGKTLGFGVPLLHRIDPDTDLVQALVICPTRELTVQVADDLQIGKNRGLNVVAIYGGMPIEPQIDALKTAHVVVGTPGRLLDHMGRGTLVLSGVTELVMDEADEMLDMGFLPDVERLVAATGSGPRHTMLFSATMPPAIVSLARRYMQQPTFLRAASDEPETAPTVDQYFLNVHRMDKPRVLARIMQSPGRGGAFVFTRTKNMASRLVEELETLGVTAVAVHGDLRQVARERNLDKFRQGKADILVATEVAARGLDVDNVTHVINYDCPDDHKMYLHRIGRTARAGAKGVAVTFCEFNEIDRVNVIRKAVEAHDGEDPVEVFSTSDLLADWFDLPDETPWAAARHARRESGGGQRKDRSSRGPKGRSGGDRDRDGKGRDDRGRGDKPSRGDRGRDAEPVRQGRSRPDESPRGDRDRGDDRGEARGGRGRERSKGTARDAGRTGTDPTTIAEFSDTEERAVEERVETRVRERSRSRDRARGTDDPRRTRTAADDRPTRDAQADRGRDDRGRSGDAGGRAARSSAGPDGPTKGERSTASDDQAAKAPRKRARTRARGGRPAGTTGDTASSDKGPDRGAATGRSSGSGEQRSRSARTGNGKERDDDRGQSRSDGRSRSNGKSRSEARSRDGGNQSRSGGGSRSGSSRGNDHRSNRRGASRPSESDPRAHRTRKTSSDVPTRRGVDARGDGKPGLSRHVEVEHLP